MNKMIASISNNIKEIVREVIKEESNKFANWFKSMMADEDKFLTREQTAEYLSMSPSTLRRHTINGHIKAYGIGTRVYYNLNDIKSAMKPIN